MADPVRATKLDPSSAFDPNTDYLMAVRGDADGPRSGPYLVPGIRVSVGSAATGGDGTGGTTPPPTGGITKVFGRTGPEIAAAASDYDAAQIDYDAANSGLAADNVQTAIDAVVALRATLPVPGSDGDLLTATGGEWSSQPPAVESAFGRSGAIDAATGDYHADQIIVEKEVDGLTVATTNQFVTAAQIAKLTALDAALQLPDPTAATVDHVLTVVGSGETKVWAAAAPAPGSGAGLSQIDLMPLFRPSTSAPPSWVYDGGSGTWLFSNSGSQILYAEIGYWPGGTVDVHIAATASVTSGNLGFDIRVAATTPGGSELWDRSFVNNTAYAAVPGTLKRVVDITNTLDALDGAAVGDFVRILFTRNNSVGSNAAGTGVVRGATLVFSA